MIGHRTTLREELATRLRSLPRGTHGREEFWALDDVSFTVADGESLGIVGRNGAGKTTILKILTRIAVPTRGVARTRGRVAALLEVGTGFHAELTGRENVYLNGAILGMTRREIARQFDAIVDFSGVEHYLDTPVKKYSSGMQVRLAFAVAAHVDPDILVVDEVLAVGDAEFRRKCVDRMKDAEREGRTVLFVSHDLEAVANLCPRALWLEAGSIRGEGSARDVLASYLRSSVTTAEVSPLQALTRGPVTLRGVRVTGEGSPADSPLLRDDPLRVSVEFSLSEPLAGFDVAIYVISRNGVRLIDATASDSAPRNLDAGTYVADMSIPPVLNVGDYTVGVWFGQGYEEILDQPTAGFFTLHGSDFGRPDRAVILDTPIVVQRQNKASGVGLERSSGDDDGKSGILRQ